MTCLGYNAGDLRNYFFDFYGEDGLLNIWGYNTSMDWDEPLGTGKNEWYMQEINSYSPPNSQERYELC